MNTITIHDGDITKAVVHRPNEIRVSVNADGTIDLMDFRLLPDSDRIRKGLRQEDVPSWIIESISMLRIANAMDYVPNLGFRVSDTLYYILDKTGESDECKEN